MKGDKGKSKLIPGMKVKQTAPGKGLATILNDQYFAAPSPVTGSSKKSPKSPKGAAKTAKAASNPQGNNDLHYVLVNAGDTVEVSLETPELLQTVKQVNLKEPEPKVKDDSHLEAAKLRQRNSELEHEMAALKASVKSKEAAEKMANSMASAEARYSSDKKRLAQAWQIEELRTSNDRSMAGAAKGAEPENIVALRAEVETLRWTVADLSERAEASIAMARGQQSSALLRAAFCESALNAVARRGQVGGGGAAATGDAGGALALLRNAEAVLPWQKKVAAADERSQLLAAQLAALQSPSQEVAGLRSMLAEKDALLRAKEEEMEDLSRALKRTEGEFRRVEEELQEEQAETRDLRARLKAASQAGPVPERPASAKALSPVAMAAALALAASTPAASAVTEVSKPRAAAVSPAPPPQDAKKKEGGSAVDSPSKTHKKKANKKEAAQTPVTELPAPLSLAPPPVPPPVLPIDSPVKTPKKKATKKEGTTEAPAPAPPHPPAPSPAPPAAHAVRKKDGAAAVDSPTKVQKKKAPKKEPAALLNVGPPSAPSPSPLPKAQPSTTTPQAQVKARATTPVPFVAMAAAAAATPPALAVAERRPLFSPAALKGGVARPPAPVLAGGGHEEKTLLLQMKLKGAKERALLAAACSGIGTGRASVEVSLLSGELVKMGKVAAARKELLALAVA